MARNLFHAIPCELHSDCRVMSRYGGNRCDFGLIFLGQIMMRNIQVLLIE